MNDRPSKHAHQLVFDTAEAMAHELYGTLMADNNWYGLWKRKNPDLGPKGLEELFVTNNIGKLLPQARSTLAAMLRNPDHAGADPASQELIYEALILDATLVRGRPH